MKTCGLKNVRMSFGSAYIQPMEWAAWQWWWSSSPLLALACVWWGWSQGGACSLAGTRAHHPTQTHQDRQLVPHSAVPPFPENGQYTQQIFLVTFKSQPFFNKAISPASKDKAIQVNLLACTIFHSKDYIVNYKSNKTILMEKQHTTVVMFLGTGLCFCLQDLYKHVRLEPIGQNITIVQWFPSICFKLKNIIIIMNIA